MRCGSRKSPAHTTRRGRSQLSVDLIAPEASRSRAPALAEALALEWARSSRRPPAERSRPAWPPLRAPRRARHRGRARALSRRARPVRSQMRAQPILSARRAEPTGSGLARGKRTRTQERPPSPPPPETCEGGFAGPVPLCVDFVNTSRTNKHFVREVGRSVASAFSRYEIVTTRKRAFKPARRPPRSADPRGSVPSRFEG